MTQSSSCSLLQSRLTKLKKPFIIGIAGDSGSGKTVFSDGIRRILGRDLVASITMDGYHKENRAERSVSGRLPLDPEANKFDLLREHLAALKNNQSIDVPQYNHKTGDFDAPRRLNPVPIIILEGLHPLYPEFLEFLDLKIFVDPDRDIKWQWKFARDIQKRGHKAEELEEEMLVRESAYKRWIDFQKINADIVIKIFNTRMHEFARYDFTKPLPDTFYKVELIMRPSPVHLPPMSLPFDLSNIMDINENPFLLAATPCYYWGQPVVDIHLDGAFSPETISALETHISSCTTINIDPEASEVKIPRKEEKFLNSTDFTQLLVAWRFLEAANHTLLMEEEVNTQS